MKIGLVVHGPEVIDSGGCSFILKLLQDHEIAAKLGGIMGKTAVLDAELEKIIDIKDTKRPSEQLDEMLTKNFDLIILLNHGKTSESGLAFGGGVISNSKNFSDAIPVVQVERPMEKNGIIVAWNESGKKILENLKELNNLKIFERNITIPQRFKKRAGRNYRKLIGVNPNEKIFLNNVIIGYSKSNEVTLVEKDGKIVDIIGGTLNPHGLEKIKEKINLKSAMIKTAEIVRNKPPQLHRIIDKISRTGKIAILFNAARVYNIILEGFDLIISIGDDTTAIIADSASRFNIPVIGIIDGDMDCLLNSINKDLTLEELGNIISPAPYSILIQVNSGLDDDVGKLIQSSIFEGKEILEIKNFNLFEFKESIIDLISEYIVSFYEKFK